MKYIPIESETWSQMQQNKRHSSIRHCDARRHETEQVVEQFFGSTVDEERSSNRTELQQK